MASLDTRNFHKILEEKQALISQKYKKSLEAKALMNHFQNNELQKVYNQRNKFEEKIQQMQWSKEQNLRHLYEIQMKKQIKQHRKNEYSKNYDEMINYKKQKEQEQKNHQLWLEKRLLNEDTWLRDTAQQKQIEKQKRLQYGKQLEKHLKIQEEKRNEEAARIKQQRDRLKKETFEISRNNQPDILMKYKGKSLLEQRNSENLGVKGLLNWSQIGQSNPDDSNQPLTPRMDRMLRMQRQSYQKGESTQFKNEQQKRYFQRNDPQKSIVSNQKAENYNPITNPIPFRYKNPNVLRVLSSFS